MLLLPYVHDCDYTVHYSCMRKRWHECNWSTVEHDCSTFSAKRIALCHKQCIVEGKLGRCVVAVGVGGLWRECRVGGHSTGLIHTNPQ